MTAPQSRRDRAFRHEVVFYAGRDDLVGRLAPFVAEGVARREPVLAVLTRDKIERLRTALGHAADEVAFADMAEVGRNPARIIPAWQEFLDDAARSGRPARGIGEPIWPGRSADELAECHLHESLLNVAFGDAPMWLVCPYDTTALEPSVVEEAMRTHPLVAADDACAASGAYHRGVITPTALAPAPADAWRITYDVTALRRVRAYVGRQALALGLDPERADTLVFVANELVTNTLRYGGGRGRLALWRSGGDVVCDVSDQGWIPEPLVGRVRPAPEQEGGRGIWLANQLCDLVQIRTEPAGTTVRIRLAG